MTEDILAPGGRAAITLQDVRSQEVCVIFKDLSAGFLVTPPAAIVSPHLMSPLASRDIFTGFSPNSGNDLAVTLLPVYLGLGKQEAAQTR